MPRTAKPKQCISIRLSPQSKRTQEQSAPDADEAITLNAEEWDRLQELLLNPPKPNEKLKEALAWHQQVVRG